MNSFELQYIGGYLSTGGELILTVFEKRLPDAIEKQPFKKILEVNYVKRVIEEADGIQPHLVAPEVRPRE